MFFGQTTPCPAIQEQSSHDERYVAENQRPSPAEQGASEGERKPKEYGVSAQESGEEEPAKATLGPRRPQRPPEARRLDSLNKTLEV